MRSTLCIRLLAIFLVVSSSLLFASSAALRINEAKMSAVISEKEIALVAPISNRLKARTAPSVLYDYYNPEALVTLPPADFNIKPNPESEPGKTVAAE